MSLKQSTNAFIKVNVYFLSSLIWYLTNTEGTQSRYKNCKISTVYKKVCRYLIMIEIICLQKKSERIPHQKSSVYRSKVCTYLTRNHLFTVNCANTLLCQKSTVSLIPSRVSHSKSTKHLYTYKDSWVYSLHTVRTLQSEH